MISSLPKPIQNDVDTVIIDLLSKYSLDNKNVRQFVQTVAQQVRGLNKSIPKLLKTASKGSKEPDTSKNETSSKQDNDSSSKPGFLTRLDNLQTSFNKGGLLGVIFEHFKNKQSDSNTINAVAPSKEGNISTDSKQEQSREKQPTEKTSFLEKVSSKFDKLEEIQKTFETKGLFGVAQNFIKDLKNKKESQKQDLDKPSVVSTTYNTDTENKSTTTSPTTNFSTVNTTSTETNDQSTNIDTSNAPFETEQAQAQNLLPDEVVVLIGGVNEYGRKDLSDVIKSSLKEFFEEQEKNKGGLFAGVKSAGTGTDDSSGDGGEGGLLSLIADIAMIKSGFGGKGRIGKLLGKGKGLFGKAAGGVKSLFGKGAVTAAATKTAGVGAGTAGAAATGATVLGGLAIGGTIGTGIAKNETFSEFMYGDKDAGKKAMEEYDTGFLGLMAVPQLFRASYDAMNAIGEAKEARQRLEKMEKQTIPLDIKAMMLGYKNLADFGAAKASGKEKRGMYWDEQKQSVVVVQPDKSLEIHKFVYGKGFQGKPEIISSDGKANKKEKSTGEENIKAAAEAPSTEKINPNTTISEPPNVKSVEQEQTSTEKAATEQSTLTPENTTQPVVKTDTAIDQNKTTAQVPENTKTTSNIYVPKDLSSTEMKKWSESVKEHLKTEKTQTTLTQALGTLGTTKLEDNKLTNPTLDTTTQYPEAKPIIDKNFKPIQPLEYKTEPVKPFKFDTLKTSDSLLASPLNTEEKDITPLTPGITDIPTPTSPNITENHITNNNADKDILSNIAGNTEKTSKSITSLSEAVFALAKVFDSKSSNGSNNIVNVNNGQQVQQYTTTAQKAAANKDAIRDIRRQFLHVIG